MIGTRKLILTVFVIAAGLSAACAVAGRLSLVPGIFLGAGIGVMNFLFLQVSVRSMTSSSFAGSAAKIVAAYMARFFLKLVILAALLFVFVRVINISWPGLLIGLYVSMAVYIYKVSNIRKMQCQ